MRVSHEKPECKKFLLYLTSVSSHAGLSSQQTTGMDTVLVFTSSNDA